MYRSDTDEGAFLAESRQSLRGRTALVISCGPSMSQWQEVLSSLEQESAFVVCVKQAIDEVGDRCDLHVFNVYNIQRYRYGQRIPTRVLGMAPNAPPVFAAHDHRYMVRKKSTNNSDLQATLAGRLSFDDHGFERTGMSDRPWGPGVMYEFVLPYLAWCGVSKIETVGWDIADPHGKNQHFYDKKGRSSGIRQSFVQKAGKFVFFVMRRHRLTLAAYNLVCHAIGKRYNPAPMLDGEAELIASSIPKLRRWLLEQEIELVVHSTSGWMKQASSAQT